MIITSEILNKMVADLGLRFPVAKISKDLRVSKGAVSEYLKGKKIPSGNFIKQFETFYKVKSLDYIQEGNTSKEKTTSHQHLSEEHKQIISDAFLLHEKEVRQITIVNKIILAERLDAENNILKELKGLKRTN